MLTAWGDESGSRPDLDPGAYLLAAALIEEADLPVVRSTMLEQQGNEDKVHWYSRDAARRSELVEVVASLPVAAFCVVHEEIGATDRRHRRKCLEFLLPHLAAMPCAAMTFESRANLDASDIATLQLLRSRRAIESNLRISHVVGRDEPALWVADAVCGAIVQSRIGQPKHLTRLGGSVEVHVI
ncbi:hypothetical protein LB823_05970 [Tsukamurella sp. M9C]|uniref:hypothetical protein n=1 Tax=unclassified Tsukamurella TaxID=2633480 RepID=UPI001CCB622F|nr:hypothetical protein [Tsukamurella sp. M9C]MCA0155737.1 hypothetical protein [Tsukamurella sp. M9C]